MHLSIILSVPICFLLITCPETSEGASRKILLKKLVALLLLGGRKKIYTVPFPIPLPFPFITKTVPIIYKQRIPVPVKVPVPVPYPEPVPYPVEVPMDDYMIDDIYPSESTTKMHKNYSHNRHENNYDLEHDNEDIDKSQEQYHYSNNLSSLHQNRYHYPHRYSGPIPNQVRSELKDRLKNYGHPYRHYHSHSHFRQPDFRFRNEEPIYKD